MAPVAGWRRLAEGRVEADHAAGDIAVIRVPTEGDEPCRLDTAHRNLEQLIRP